MSMFFLPFLEKCVFWLKLAGLQYFWHNQMSLELHRGREGLLLPFKSYHIIYMYPLCLHKPCDRMDSIPLVLASVSIRYLCLCLMGMWGCWVDQAALQYLEYTEVPLHYLHCAREGLLLHLQWKGCYNFYILQPSTWQPQVKMDEMTLAFSLSLSKMIVLLLVIEEVKVVFVFLALLVG